MNEPVYEMRSVMIHTDDVLALRLVAAQLLGLVIRMRDEAKPDDREAIEGGLDLSSHLQNLVDRIETGEDSYVHAPEVVGQA